MTQADWTDEECNSLYSHPGSFDWERYIDHMNTMNANEGYIGNQDVIVSEAVKKVCIYYP